jgi:hypothetical protein
MSHLTLVRMACRKGFLLRQRGRSVVLFELPLNKFPVDSPHTVGNYLAAGLYVIFV